ncbi:PepSY domain-containing protein [Priestia aryabhattai]|uniref:PepSY domain-containing protein n=1 Tax=Priestia aryabhattai TaxID=412384 RepID=UPI001C0D2BB2|nr:PepSY domain-containing protein [Priestia aryabhattai]MBU3568654.1 PepSY domain-containing protein [Priestia aryabhattai]
MIGKLAMGKAVVGIALGAMIGVSGVSSSFAAETPHANSTKAVSQHQVKQYSENQARAIALKAKPGKFKSVSFHNNVYTYIIYKDGHDFKVTVNAKTGAVLKMLTLK